jgi:hypothetical protein
LLIDIGGGSVELTLIDRGAIIFSESVNLGTVRLLEMVREKNQALNTTYRPNRKGRRMWCLSERRSLRLAFIKFFKELMRQARAVRKRWKMGNFTVPYPPGLHPPSMPKLANVIGC